MSSSAARTAPTMTFGLRVAGAGACGAAAIPTATGAAPSGIEPGAGPSAPGCGTPGREAVAVAFVPLAPAQAPRGMLRLRDGIDGIDGSDE